MTTAESTPLVEHDRILLSVEEAAELLNIGRTTMFRLVTSGQVSSVRIGRLRRVPLDALHAFAAELQR